MLFLTFGAALLGVMEPHKLKERRIFNLLLENKNHLLLSLQLLLQVSSFSLAYACNAILLLCVSLFQ
ncbi:hypothetical protein REPUB_Repub01dG0135200 [Reevesia pubescens]